MVAFFHGILITCFHWRALISLHHIQNGLYRVVFIQILLTLLSCIGHCNYFRFIVVHDASYCYKYNSQYFIIYGKS